MGLACGRYGDSVYGPVGSQIRLEWLSPIIAEFSDRNTRHYRAISTSDLMFVKVVWRG